MAAGSCSTSPPWCAQAKGGREGHGILLRFLNEDHNGANWSGYDLVSREGAGEWASRRPMLLVLDTSRPRLPQSPVVDPELVKRCPFPIVGTVPVTKDCMILAYLPEQNIGHVDNLGLANNDGGVRVLIDWPEIPRVEARATRPAVPDRALFAQDDVASSGRACPGIRDPGRLARDDLLELTASIQC